VAAGMDRAWNPGVKKKRKRGLARFTDGLLITCFLIVGPLLSRVRDDAAAYFPQCARKGSYDSIGELHFLSYSVGRSMAPKNGCASVGDWIVLPMQFKSGPPGRPTFRGSAWRGLRVGFLLTLRFYMSYSTVLV
jgi:hypothetical protein